MKAAKFANGAMTRIGKDAGPRSVVTSSDVADHEKLARAVGDIQKQMAAASGFVPRRIDFEDIDVDDTATTKYRLHHGFGGRVRWWVVGCSGTSTWSAALTEHADTDENTLVLVSWEPAKVTIRVEEAG